jgi:thioredoxin-dependent peroxiredoxin
VQILGCSFDTPEDNRKFAGKFNYDFPLLCDTTKAIGLAYGAADSPDAGYPQRISYVIAPDGKIAHVFEKVSAATHPAELLALL